MEQERETFLVEVGSSQILYNLDVQLTNMLVTKVFFYCSVDLLISEIQNGLSCCAHLFVLRAMFVHVCASEYKFMGQHMVFHISGILSG